MKNRYKAFRGKRQVVVEASNLQEAEASARLLLNTPRAMIKLQYVGSSGQPPTSNHRE